MIELIKNFFEDPKTNSLSLFIGLAIGVAITWTISSQINDRIVIALEAEKAQLLLVNAGLKKNIKELKPLEVNLTKLQHKSCDAITKMISDKKVELIEKEEQVRIAAPLMIGAESEINSNSLYARRLNQLSSIQNQLDLLNEKLIKCL